MLKSLYWKVTLAIMLVAFITAGLVGIFIRITNQDRLSQFIIDQQRSNLQTVLAQYYSENGSWTGVNENWQQLQNRSFPTPSATQMADQAHGQTQGYGYHPPDGQGGGPARGNFLGLADAQGKVIVSVDPNYPIGSTATAGALKDGAAITVDSQQVGTILAPRQPPNFNPQENLYLQRTNEALLYASLGALLIAMLVGIILARQLTGPLHELTKAAQRITQGQLDQQVKVKSNDEIGQLATAFNRMSQEVARVNQLRRQMTADIAHDLRTPLTVISGYIESMRDGVLKPTPQRLELIYSEIERLQNLVGDLRMLSLADAGELSLHPAPVTPRALLDRAAALFRHQAEQQEVSIEVNAPEDLPEIRVDEDRLMQVLGNLICNALRYTPETGKITLAAQAQDGQVDLQVQDTGEGIDPTELPYIFDRFHRADKSRHTETGESGLGLAIVKALVESHGGSASAESVQGHGTVIHLSFPAEHPS
jgi:signal transduction histidine kinase